MSYATSVIENISTWNNGDTSRLLQDIQSKIFKSTKIYCGDAGPTSVDIGFGSMQKCFQSGEMKMPSECCWFDWDTAPSGNKERSSRRGILATEERSDPDVLSLYPFFFLDERKTWETHGINYWISVGCPWKENTHINEIIKDEGFSLEDRNIDNIPRDITILHVRRLDTGTDTLDAFSEDCVDIAVFEYLLKLINCKNIAMNDVYPPEKLNRKRIKKNKTPFFRHKTLKIALTSKKTQNQTSQQTYDMPLHFCRGHFKEYTKEKPLFGKLVGRYWWHPQARGAGSNGVIFKNYSL